MARADTRLEPAPKIPPVTALKTVARVGALPAALSAADRVRGDRPRRRGGRRAGHRAGPASSSSTAALPRPTPASSIACSALMLVVIVVMAAATYMRFYHVSWLGERITADLRRTVFDHLLELPPAFFEATRTGEVISRLINDTTMLETVIGSSASMAIRNFLLMVGGLVMLALTSPKLTLLVLAGVPLVVVPIILFGRRVRKLARATQDRVGDVGAFLDESLHEIRTVQAYGHEDARSARLRRARRSGVRHRGATAFASARCWWRR